MSKTEKILLGVALVAGLVGLVLPRYSIPSLGGVTRSDFGTTGRLYADIINSTTSATFAGTFAVTGATTLTGETTLGNCGTASYTIPALSPTFSQVGATTATTSVTVTGSALGDVALVSNNSSTQALAFYGVSQSAVISAAGTAVVMFTNGSIATSTAVQTSTITVCYFD